MIIIKGILIGIGKIIPGVSGAVIAIGLGVYEKSIDIINKCYKASKEELIFILKLIFGFSISLLVFSRIILFFININYMATIFLFAGLIIGSVKSIKKQITKKHMLYTYISFLLCILLGIISINTNINTTSDIIYIIIGFVESITMIIPGISGTAIFMLLGVYDKYLLFISNLTILNFHIAQVLYFSIGIILGTILTIKLMNYLFKKNQSFIYSLILGFSISSVFLMMIKCLDNSNLTNYLISCILFVVGLKISKKINRFD